MKRPLQLPLAIALALGGTDALALGLGTIHVNSKLNQPLDAEIPVLQGTQGEAEGLLVQLAAAEDFDRIGLNRSRLNVPLEFSLVKNNRGDMVIKVTSKEVVREPFLDFLVEANWPKGRLLREYTVLLDPPVMAPAAGSAVTAAARTPERAPTQALPESKPKSAPAKPRSAPVAVAPPSEAPPKAAPAPKRAGSNEYTVEAGDTLSGIARSVRPDESTNVNQLMLALLKQNPSAFYKDNINALKRGSILRIPSADEIKATGSASEAAAQVQSQIEDWRGGAAAKPTLVADTGTKPEPKAAPPAKAPPSTTTTASAGKPKTGSERLELVPPKAGKDSIAAADRPGSGAGSSASGSSELRAELARTKEALTSREQETGELKSRVKELEETKSKTDRLLSLKDSEIADLQNKLKELQDASKTGAKTTTAPASAAAPATVATTPSAATAPKTGDKVSKEDIWGSAGGAASDKTAAATPPSATSTTPPPAAGATASTSTGAATPAGSTTPSSTTTAATTAPSATTSTPGATATSTPPATPGAPTPGTSATTSTTTPSTTTPSTTPGAVATTSKPTATTTPIKADAKLKTQPLPKSAPAFYEESWFKPAAIGGAALLVLLALLGLRGKRKAATATERGSIAGAFGDSPLKPAEGAETFAADSEEQSLRDHLLGDPTNIGLHLELLSLLYAERNVAAFEDAAEAMQAYVTDPHQPEWLEAKAMGQELAPHNPLFADGAAAHDDYANAAFDDEAVTASHATAPSSYARHDDDIFAPRYDEPLIAEPGAPSPTSVEEPFDFDLGPSTPTPAPPPPAASEPAFAFDDLPPLNFTQEARHEIAEAAAPAAPLSVDEDEFPAEDGVGTKLDLAKAYLDMGDPEGARSMLEEVLAEGNDTQKGEARRLMADIR